MPVATKSKRLTESQKLIRANGKRSLAQMHQLKDGEKFIFFTPAFEAIDSDPSKNYGIGGVTAVFAERRGDLVIECAFYTEWYLPETQQRLSKTPPSTYYRPQPTCNGIFWHYPKRTSEWQSKNKECALSGRTCFGEAGSALYAEKITERFLVEGGSAVWDEINEAFKEAKNG